MLGESTCDQSKQTILAWSKLQVTSHNWFIGNIFGWLTITAAGCAIFSLSSPYSTDMLQFSLKFFLFISAVNVCHGFFEWKNCGKYKFTSERMITEWYTMFSIFMLIDSLWMKLVRLSTCGYDWKRLKIVPFFYSMEEKEKHDIKG